MVKHTQAPLDQAFHGECRKSTCGVMSSSLLLLCGAQTGISNPLFNRKRLCLFCAAIKDLWEHIQPAIAPAWEQLKDILQPVLRPMGEHVGPVLHQANTHLRQFEPVTIAALAVSGTFVLLKLAGALRRVTTVLLVGVAIAYAWPLVAEQIKQH